MKQAYEMTFREFAESVKASGSVNRLMQIGASKEVLIYEAYLKGDSAEQLPDSLRETQVADVMLHQLTAKLGLDSGSFRDNLRTAELVAVREAWMGAVLRGSGRLGDPKPLDERVVADYEMLTDGFVHPWLKEQIEAQRARSQNLKPVLEEASAVVGKPVEDRVPDPVNTGKIVSQNRDYTVQATNAGQVVAHENERLKDVPALGDDVTIMYYRGDGQVFENGRRLEVSAPYLDPQNGDLAIDVREAGKEEVQTVLFAGVSAFSAFARAQGLGDALVKEAVEVLASRPKVPAKPKAERLPNGEVTVDAKTGALCWPFVEDGVPYSALFEGMVEFRRLAQEFGVTGQALDRAEILSQEMELLGVDRVVQREQSLRLAREAAAKTCAEIVLANDESGRYAGVVLAVTDYHVVQHGGPGQAVVHDKLNLDKVPDVGQKLSVRYAGGRGAVVDRGVLKANER